jgi:hypothetical protein
MKAETKHLKAGQRFYDWQVSANVIVLEPYSESNNHYPKCLVENTGVEYVARVDALEAVRKDDTRFELIDESINNKVKSIAEHKFNDIKLLEMIESASLDRENEITPKTAYPEHPLWGINKKYVTKGDTSFKLKYLLVHGFTPECLFDQAGVV